MLKIWEDLYPSLSKKSKISFNLVGLTLRVVGYFELIYRIVVSGTFNLLAKYCAVEPLLRITLLSCFILIVLRKCIHTQISFHKTLGV